MLRMSSSTMLESLHSHAVEQKVLSGCYEVRLSRGVRLGVELDGRVWYVLAVGMEVVLQAVNGLL